MDSLTAIKTKQAVGALLLFACILKLPMSIAVARAGYQTGATSGGVFLAITASLLMIVGWLLTTVAGLALVRKSRFATIALLIAAIAVMIVGGPAFVPFITVLVPGAFYDFVLVNLAVVCFVFYLDSNGKSERSSSQ